MQLVHVQSMNECKEYLDAQENLTPAEREAKLADHRVCTHMLLILTMVLICLDAWIFMSTHECRCARL